jgi:protein O-mannosyl-transferase
LTNIAIHIMAALTLGGIVRRTLLLPSMSAFERAADPLALAVALLWLTHPLQTQAVTYIVQRYESMMGLFYLLTLYAAVRSATAAKPLGWITISVLACLMAMGCKEVAVSAPIIVLLYDRAFLSGSFGEALRRHATLYAGLAATWLIFLPFYRSFSGGEGQWAGFGLKTSWWDYALTQPGVLLRYLKLCAWPNDLCFDYAWPIAHSPAAILPPLAIIVALLLATLWCLLRAPKWGFLGAWFFLILAPTSSIMPVADPANEHRMYLPLAAVIGLVVIGGYWLSSRWTALHGHRQAAGIGGSIAVLLVVVAAAAATHDRNEVYRTALALWEDTVRKKPDNNRANYSAALEYAYAGNADRALELARVAVAGQPNSADSHNALGIAYVSAGQLEPGIKALNKALELATTDTQRAMILFNLAFTHQRMQDYPAALDELNRQIELQADNAQAYNERGVVLQKFGRYVEAKQDFTQAIALQPDDGKPYHNRGITYGMMGQPVESIPDLTQAIALDPACIEFHASRAISYARMGAFELAGQDLEIIRQLGGQPDPEVLQAVTKALQRSH